MNKKLVRRKTRISGKDLKSALEIVVAGMMPYIQKVIEPFLVSYPYWGLTIYAVIGLFGVYLATKQNELNELIIFIKGHPKEFRKKIVESEEFRKGFITFFDSYIKQRLERKRVILRAILLDFTISQHKETFELERLQDVLLRISPDGLENLIFLKKEILPVLEKEVDEELRKIKYLPEEKQRILDGIWARRSVSEAVDKWIYDRYNINSSHVKKQYGITKHDPEISAKIANIEHEVRKGKTDCWPELLSLGIFRFTLGRMTYGGGASVNYALTTFGMRFIDYIISVNQK